MIAYGLILLLSLALAWLALHKRAIAQKARVARGRKRTRTKRATALPE